MSEALTKEEILYEAYFDDSGSHAQAERYILAGYLSPVTEWKRLTQRWNRALDRFGLSMFHMKDVEAMRDERGLRGPQWRDEVVSTFSDIVWQHAHRPLWAEIPVREYTETVVPFFRTLQWKEALDGFSNPYNLLMMRTIRGVAEECRKLGINRKTVRIVFAHQDRLAYARELRLPVGLQAGLHWAPVWEQAKDTPPLQAADMLAWLCHRFPAPTNATVRLRHVPLICRGYSCCPINGAWLTEWAAFMHASAAQKKAEIDAGN